MHPRHRFPCALWLVGFFGVLPASGQADQADQPARPEAPLSETPRTLRDGEALPCKRHDLPLVRYRGTGLRYRRTLWAHRDFVPRLRAFEDVVAAVATRFYGRPPRRIVHLGGYNCRRMRRYPNWISEHALGNALDLAGFDFGRAAAGSELPEDMPRALRFGFSVRVQDHFRKRRGRSGYHGAFLRALTRQLIARRDVFSVVLGPGWPGHENHLHLDAAPYRVVEVDLPQTASR